MRTISIISVVILGLAHAAIAQDWSEFKSRDDRFTITFPQQPTITQSTYTSQSGSSLPSRIYSAASGASNYSVTVVDFTNIQAIATEKAKNCPAGAEPCSGGLAASSATGAGYWKADLAGAVVYATYQFLQRNAKLEYLGWNSADLVEGNMLSLLNPDKSRTSAGIYMHENKLYILEGHVPPGYPDPGFFQQSIGWLDGDGNGIRYQTLYHNGFAKPPVTVQRNPN